MQDAERLAVELIELARPWSGCFGPISPQSALHHDLHIDGDDSDEFLTEVVTRYGTSFDGFDFAAFFPNETDAPYYYWLEKLGLFRKRFRRLTIAHLVAVIERGKWFEPNEPTAEIAAPEPGKY